MHDDPTTGRLLTLAAVAALLAAAWWGRSLVFPSGPAPWTAVPAAVLLAIHLVHGYRGVRWIVGSLLLAFGTTLAYDTAVSASKPLDVRVAGRIALALLTAALGLSLGVSKAVRAYLAHRREQRTFNTAVFLAACWTAALAAVAVWFWSLIAHGVLF
jgi:hypothetical protein